MIALDVACAIGLTILVRTGRGDVESCGTAFDFFAGVFTSVHLCQASAGGSVQNLFHAARAGKKGCDM